MDTKLKARVVNCTCTTIDDGIPSSLTPVVVFLSSGTAIAQTDCLLKFLCCHLLPPTNPFCGLIRPKAPEFSMGPLGGQWFTFYLLFLKQFLKQPLCLMHNARRYFFTKFFAFSC